MTLGSSSERSSVRDMVLPAPRERVSFLSGSALARLSERVTGVWERSDSAAATSASASACPLVPVDSSDAPVSAAAAPRSATLVVDESDPSSALSESAPRADREAGGHDGHRGERERGLEGRLGRASGLGGAVLTGLRRGRRHEWGPNQ